MIYIFGPYAAGKREYVRETFGYTEADFSTKAEDNCRVLYDAQQLASKVGNRPEELEKLAEQLCRKEVVITAVWTDRQQGRCGRNERKIWSRR